jgi:PAS domain S-box-containing protein
MQQGAAMLNENGCILYANLSLGSLLGIERESLISFPLEKFLVVDDREAYRNLFASLQDGDAQSSAREVELRALRGDGDTVAVQLSFSLLSRDKSAIGVLVTDLTARNEQIDLASRFQRMQDDERKRIARELHDSVG